MIKFLYFKINDLTINNKIIFYINNKITKNLIKLYNFFNIFQLLNIRVF